MIGYAVAIALLLLASAFFSSTEIAVTMASRVRLRTRAERGVRGARWAEQLLQHPERAIVTCLVGNTLVNVAAGVYARAAVLVAHPMSEAAADAIATVAVVPLVLVLGEVIPKALAQTFPNRTLAALALPLVIVRVILAPLTHSSFAVARLVRRMAHLRSDLLDFLSREELKQFVAHSEKHGHVDRDERELIYQIFEFWKLDPARFVRPLQEVPRLACTASAGAAKELMREQHLARLVVTDAAQRDVLGIVTATALLEAPNDSQLEQYVQQPVRAQLGQGVDRLLADLQRSPSQIAVVPAGRGGLAGVILLDDLLQHLLGRDALSTFGKRLPQAS
jgi:CBS domain containing-hemolysin-like protein